MYNKKSAVLSPTPDFYTFKYIYTIIGQEDQNVATIDLPSFFLQTKMKGDNKIVLKLTGAGAFLLIELDSEKWRKYLVKENSK